MGGERKRRTAALKRKAEAAPAAAAAAPAAAVAAAPAAEAAAVDRLPLQPVYDPANSLYKWFVNARTLLAEKETGELVPAGAAVAAWARVRRSQPELLATEKEEARPAVVQWLLQDWESSTGSSVKTGLTAEEVGGGTLPPRPHTPPRARHADPEEGGSSSGAAPRGSASACSPPKHVGEDEDRDEEAFADGDLWGGRRGRSDCYTAREHERVGDLMVSGVCLQYEDKVLLQQTQLRLLQGHRYGFVGKNGTGKTTLLRAIARRTLPGIPRHLRAWYVRQELTASEESCLDAVIRADGERTALLAECERLESETGDDAAAEAEQLVQIQERLDEIDAHTADERARKVLRGLQFTPEMIEGPTSNLSGGWRQRVALAQALFVRQRLDVLLLDEPTNHLDLPALLWLERVLTEQSSGLTVVIVSHDTAFLDDVVTDVMHLEHRKLQLEYFPGSYTEWQEVVEEKGRRDGVMAAAAERQEKKAKAFIEKQRSMANSKHRDDNKQRQAAERVKKMERFGRLGIGGAHQRGVKVKWVGIAGMHREDGRRFRLMSLKTLDEAAMRWPKYVERLRSDPECRFRFPTGAMLSTADTPLVSFDRAALGYAGRSEPVLSDINATIRVGSRIAIVGPNGAGKTTLLKLITGSDEVVTMAGEVQRHPGTRIAYVAQHHIDALSRHAASSACKFLMTEFGEAQGVGTEHAARSHLGAFGLGGPVALRPIGTYSGGQKARLAFAVASLPVDSPPHMLVLDEPTNHLDSDAATALIAGLCEFTGAVVLVSHNRAFISSTCGDLWVVMKGGVKVTMHTEGDDGDAFDHAFQRYCDAVS